jgi:hypothetical protein
MLPGNLFHIGAIWMLAQLLDTIMTRGTSACT